MSGIKNIITIIGSFLGTIAFFQNMIKPMLIHNKSKWNEIKKKIDDIDFENIELSLYQSHRIHSKSMNKLDNFVHDIERDADELHFKTVFVNRIKKKLQKILNLYIKWRKLICVPYWDPKRLSNKDIAWTLNKNFFYERFQMTGKKEDRLKADVEYPKHMKDAYDLVVNMRKEFKEISLLANKEIYEYMFPWKWFST